MKLRLNGPIDVGLVNTLSYKPFGTLRKGFLMQEKGTFGTLMYQFLIFKKIN